MYLRFKIFQANLIFIFTLSQSETKGNKNQNRSEKLETKTNLNHNIHCVFQKVDKRVLKLGVADFFT